MSAASARLRAHAPPSSVDPASLSWRHAPRRSPPAAEYQIVAAELTIVRWPSQPNNSAACPVPLPTATLATATCTAASVRCSIRGRADRPSARLPRPYSRRGPVPAVADRRSGAGAADRAVASRAQQRTEASRVSAAYRVRMSASQSQALVFGQSPADNRGRYRERACNSEVSTRGGCRRSERSHCRTDRRLISPLA